MQLSTLATNLIDSVSELLQDDQTLEDFVNLSKETIRREFKTPEGEIDYASLGYSVADTYIRACKNPSQIRRDIDPRLLNIGSLLLTVLCGDTVPRRINEATIVNGLIGKIGLAASTIPFLSGVLMHQEVNGPLLNFLNKLIIGVKNGNRK